MDASRIARLNRISDLSDVYEALDRCGELERALMRLTRARIVDDDELGTSKAQLRRICSRVEGYIESES